MRIRKAAIAVDIMTGETSLHEIIDDSTPIACVNAVGVLLVIMANTFLIRLSATSDFMSSRGSDQLLSNLIVAMPNIANPLEGPLATSLLEESASSGATSDYGESLARRLSKRTQCQVFVSEDISQFHSMPEILLNVERRLVEFVTSSLS